jgi:hypothetical protein
MKFVLNEGLAEVASRSPYDPSTLFAPLQHEIDLLMIGNNWKRLQAKTGKVLCGPSLEGVENVQKGYLGILSKSYNLHQKITLSPHDVWYLLLSEITDIVAKNVEACRPIFTKSPDKIEIIVDTNDPATIDLNTVEQKLRTLVPVDLDVFLPAFTTMTPQARYACLAAFCDSASHYYEYGTFACGIPEIKIEGSVDDWRKVQYHALLIASLLSNVGLQFVSPWISRACRAVDNIITALNNGHADTLQNIFTQTRVGSGSQQTIDGWFVDFYLNNLRGEQMDGFPNSWCRVPYRNMNTGRKFIGIHGCLLSRRDDEGFISGDYCEIIVELSEKENGPIFSEIKQAVG